MRLACLAWGSLVWRPEPLPLAGPWQPEGPLLPIEFARVGGHGELATVLCPGVPPSRVRWAELRAVTLADARELLRRREEIEPGGLGDVGVASQLQGVPVVPGDGEHAAFAAPTIVAWARRVGLDAVIWTAVPPCFAGEEGRVPSSDEALAYLRSLRGTTLEHARRYVERVPVEIATPYRSVFEAELGWRPVTGGAEQALR